MSHRSFSITHDLHQISTYLRRPKHVCFRFLLISWTCCCLCRGGLGELLGGAGGRQCCAPAAWFCGQPRRFQPVQTKNDLAVLIELYYISLWRLKRQRTTAYVNITKPVHFFVQHMTVRLPIWCHKWCVRAEQKWPIKPKSILLCTRTQNIWTMTSHWIIVSGEVTQLSKCYSVGLDTWGSCYINVTKLCKQLKDRGRGERSRLGFESAIYYRTSQINSFLPPIWRNHM